MYQYSHFLGISILFSIGCTNCHSCKPCARPLLLHILQHLPFSFGVTNFQQEWSETSLWFWHTECLFLCLWDIVCLLLSRLFRFLLLSFINWILAYCHICAFKILYFFSFVGCFFCHTETFWLLWSVLFFFSASGLGIILFSRPIGSNLFLCSLLWLLSFQILCLCL